MWKLLSSVLTKETAEKTFSTVTSNLYNKPQTQNYWALLFAIAILWCAVNALISYCDSIWLNQFKDAIIENKRWILFVFAATMFYVIWIMRPKWSLFSHRFNVIFSFLLLIGIFFYPFTPDFWSRFWLINWANDAIYFSIFLPLWIMWYAICITPRAKDWVLNEFEIQKIKKALINPITKKKNKAFFDLKNLSTRAVVLLMSVWFVFMLTWPRFGLIWVMESYYVNTYLSIPFAVFWIWMWLTWILYEFEELRSWKLKGTTKDIGVLEENPNSKDTSIPEKKDWDILIEKNKDSELEEDSDSFDSESSESEDSDNSNTKKSADWKKDKSYDPTKADIELLKRRYKAYDSNQSLALVPWLLAIMVTVGMYFTTDPEFFNFKEYWIGLAMWISLSVIWLCVIFYHQNRRKRLYNQACNNTIYIDYVKIIKFDRYAPLNKYFKPYHDNEYWYIVVTSNWNREYKSEKFSDHELWIHNPDNSLWTKKKETTSLKIGKKTHHIWDEVRVFIDRGNHNNYYIDL